MHVRRIAIGLLILVLVPTLASAQRRAGGTGRGTKAPDWDQLAKGEPTTIVSRKDVEAMDPVRRVIDKKKELKLSDAQVALLKTMVDQAKTRDAALFDAMDSLRKEMKPSGQMDDVQRMRIQVVRRQFAATVAKVRANYDMSAKEIIPTLDEAQRPTAEELLAQQKEEADELVRTELGGRGSGGPRPGGEGAPRRPPGSA